jgi:hypothetical protein
MGQNSRSNSSIIYDIKIPRFQQIYVTLLMMSMDDNVHIIYNIILHLEINLIWIQRVSH